MRDDMEQREFVAGAEPLGPGEFYMPRLSRMTMPPARPVTLTRFASRFITLFDAEIYVPKRLDLAAFEELGDFIHILARQGETEVWTFKRFAPSYRIFLGLDLTGAGITDGRFEPYNQGLNDQLKRLVKQETPFYAGTRISELPGEKISHRLFIPMSNMARYISHCLLFSINHRIMDIHWSPPRA